jgi:hypothetical protein
MSLGERVFAYIVEAGYTPSLDMYHVISDRKGERIAKWQYDLPQPTEEQLNTVDVQKAVSDCQEKEMRATPLWIAIMAEVDKKISESKSL